MRDNQPAAAAVIVGFSFTALPNAFEWTELVLGIPIILFTFGFVVWKRGFTAEDRALFRKQGKEQPTLPPEMP